LFTGEGWLVRIAVICTLVVVNVILESTLFQYTRILGIKPDFALMIIVAYGIMRGKSYGTFIGLGTGLLIDMLYGRAFGINALSYMVTGYIIGQVQENVFKDSFIPAVVFNFAAVALFQHLYIFLAYFSNNFPSTDISYVNMLLKVILPQAIYNSIIGSIVYRLLYRLDESKLLDKRIY
jgi:rod shape-determining protein MreD